MIAEAEVLKLLNYDVAQKLTKGLPVWAEDLELVKKSWRLLLDQGAKIVYPGHGKPFPADIIRRSLL